MKKVYVYSDVRAGEDLVDMPTRWAERRLRDPSPSRGEIAAICSAYAAGVIVMAGLVAYDARVVMWVSDAAQAEFAGAEPPAPSQFVQVAVRKPVAR